ncbi:MAG: 50S ribosomal protein L1 [Candidatus Aenigmarchaeota archaeon]|nr:50S ribosomal protein L1 [Candidatus Aenigmarchaeota archaeon]
MVDEKILAAVKEARNSDKRNFKQGFDLAINLKNIDLKKPENRIKAEMSLPNDTGKKTKIGVIVDSLASQAKDMEDVIVIKRDQLEKFSKDKKGAKKLAKQCSYFVAEAPLMPLVGKNLGPILAPRNLMPVPIPPSADLKSNVNSRRNVLKIQLKTSPAIHLSVGNEEMSDEKVAENIDAIINTVISKLPKSKEQVRNYVIKLTMGKPVKFKL